MATLQEKIKILEMRKSLVESYMNLINEALNEQFLSEKKLFDPMAAFDDNSIDPEEFEKAGSQYWKDLGNTPVPQDKPGFFKRLAGKMKGAASNVGKAARHGAGGVDPSLDVDDPKFVAKSLGSSVKKAKTLTGNFKKDALATTKKINDVHDAVSDALNKFNTFVKTLPQETRGVAEREVVGLVKDFYNFLDGEKGRIDSYMKMVKQDLGKGGYESVIKEEEPTGGLNDLFFDEPMEE